LQVFDYNEFRKDKELGVASFGLDKLQEDPEQENLSLPVLSNSKPRGQIMFDVRYFPVLEGRTLEDGTKEPAPESNSGIVRYTISQAKDLDHSKSMVGQLSPYAQMKLNGRTVFTTKILKRVNNPIWEESYEMLITNRKTCKLGVTIKDERGFVDDPSVGKYQIKLTDLLEEHEKGNDWFNLAGVRSGRVKMFAQWKPVALKGVVGTGGYVTPIGVMRLHFQSAMNLRNLETMGKSDPYVRVLLSGVAKARTMTVDNDLNPSWDEVLYIPVHSAKERLTLEVMDQENLGKDRSLGAVELALSEFVREDEQGLFQVHDEKQNRNDGLILGRKGTPKGTLNYTAAFYPCLNVADPEEEEEEKKPAELDSEEQSKGGSINGTSSKEGSEKRLDVADPPQTPLSPAFTLTSETDEKKPPKLRLTLEELVSHGKSRGETCTECVLMCNRVRIARLQDHRRSDSPQRLLSRSSDG
jgi:Ca2+-dependent lipid-binding protein